MFKSKKKRLRTHDILCQGCAHSMNVFLMCWRLRHFDVFDPWVRWERGLVDLRVCPAAPAPAKSGNLEI